MRAVVPKHALPHVSRCTILESEWSLYSLQPSVKLLPSRGQDELEEHVQGNASVSTQRRPTKQRCRQVILLLLLLRFG